MAQFDSYLHAELSNYLSLFPNFQYLFTAISLGNPDFDVTIFLTIIMRHRALPHKELEDVDDKNRLHLIDLLNLSQFDWQPGMDISKYCSLIVAFFTDHARSGTLFRGKSSNIDLATICLEYLCDS